MKEKEREKNETEKNKRSEKNEIKGVEKKVPIIPRTY